MYCSSCGSQVSDQAVVCPKCGVATPKFANEMDKGDISSGAIAAFYIVGALMPVIGCVGAIYLLVKGKVGHAIGIGVVSVSMACFWFGVMNG